MTTCIFCQIIDGTLPSKPVYQDDDIIVIPDIKPKAPVHLLIIPKTHIADFMDTDPAVLLKLLSVVKHLIDSEHITHYRLVNNGGGAAFIDHVHIHLMGSIEKYREL